MLPRPASIFDDWHPFAPTGAVEAQSTAAARPLMESAVRENAGIYRMLLRDRAGVEQTLRSARMIAAQERKRYDASHGTDDAWLREHQRQMEHYDNPAVLKAYRAEGAEDIYNYLKESINASQWGWDNASQLDQMLEEEEAKREAAEEADARRWTEAGV